MPGRSDGATESLMFRVYREVAPWSYRDCNWTGLTKIGRFNGATVGNCLVTTGRRGCASRFRARSLSRVTRGWTGVNVFRVAALTLERVEADSHG